MSREYYLKNREKILSKAKEYRESNKAAIADRKRRDFEKNREARAAKQKEWKIKNAERHRERRRRYFQENKQRIYDDRKMQPWSQTAKEYHAKYREQNRERLTQKTNEWAAANPERVRAAKKRYADSSLQDKIAKKLRVRVRAVVKRAKGKKAFNTMQLVGCDISFLVGYLESLFKPGMTWENCGKGGWHIDHIKPCILFDLTQESEQLKCFNYTNLQPLWEKDNLQKGTKFLK